MKSSIKLVRLSLHCESDILFLDEQMNNNFQGVFFCTLISGSQLAIVIL